MNCKFCAATRGAYSWFAFGASALQHPLLLAMRLFWGYKFFLAGWGKLADLAQTASYFKGLGIPMPEINAVMAGGTECVGGALLMVGLGGRLVAIPLIATMIVANITQHYGEIVSASDALLPVADAGAIQLAKVVNVFGAIVSAPTKFFGVVTFPYLLTNVLVLVFGPGLLSLDAVVGCVLARRASAGPEPLAPARDQR